MAEVQRVWDAEWMRVLSADPAGESTSAVPAALPLRDSSWGGPSSCTSAGHLQLTCWGLTVALYKNVAPTGRADGTPLEPPVVDLEPPLLIRLRCTAVVLMFATVVLAAARLALRLAARHPLPTGVLTGGLAAWCAVSYIACSRPYSRARRAQRGPAAGAAAAAAAGEGDAVDGKKGQ